MDPLARYRAAQRRVRELFDPFTREHCAGCATPCCRKPSWVRPLDLILVQELGFALPAPAESPAPAAALLETLVQGPGEDAGEPCDYLGPAGCSFPPDLRPLGCAAFVCEPMRRALSPGELRRVEAAVGALRRAHERLVEALTSGAGGAGEDGAGQAASGEGSDVSCRSGSRAHQPSARAAERGCP